MQSYEINAWCWITHPQEGDVWYPVFIRDTDYLLDGEDHPIEELDSLIVKKAALPI